MFIEGIQHRPQSLNNTLLQAVLKHIIKPYRLRQTWYTQSPLTLSDHDLVQQRQQISLDVDRAFVQFGVRKESQGMLKFMLSDVLERSVTKRHFYYYQGLHDIASALVLLLGDPVVARYVLNWTIDCLFWDYVTIGSLKQTLDLQIEAVDQLVFFMRHGVLRCLCNVQGHSAKDTPPERYYYLTSWLLTCFTHDAPQVDILRLLFESLIKDKEPSMRLLYIVACLVHRSPPEGSLDFRTSSSSFHPKGTISYFRSSKVM